MRHITSLSVLLLLLTVLDALAQPAEWRPVYSYPNLFYRGLACADPANCGAVGTDGGRATVLVTTTDGGITWQPHVIEDYAITSYLPAEPHHIAPPAPGVLAVAADSGIIWMTTDGGSSFRKARLPVKRILKIQMWDAQGGIASRSTMGDLFTTTDGWRPLVESPCRIRSRAVKSPSCKFLGAILSLHMSTTGCGTRSSS